MDEQQIHDSILRYEDRIDDNISQISKLQEDYDELQFMESQIYKTQELFDEQRQYIRNNAQEMQNNYPGVNFVQLFAEHIKNSVNDAYVYKIEEELYNSAEEVKKKKSLICDEIDSIEADNIQYRNMIDEYHFELRELEED